MGETEFARAERLFLDKCILLDRIKLLESEVVDFDLQCRDLDNRANDLSRKLEIAREFIKLHVLNMCGAYEDVKIETPFSTPKEEYLAFKVGNIARQSLKEIG